MIELNQSNDWYALSLNHLVALMLMFPTAIQLTVELQLRGHFHPITNSICKIAGELYGHMFLLSAYRGVSM